MFNQTAEYALRAAVALASANLESQSSLTTSEIAQRTQVPQQYLYKVLQGLSKAGLIDVVRGKFGGYHLSRPASQISVLDVLNASSPLQRIHTCPLGRAEHAARLCPLHQQLDQAVAQVEAQLGQSYLAALVKLAQDQPVESCLGPIIPRVTPG